MSNCNDCYHCEVCHRRINGIDFLPITDCKINYRSIMFSECNDVENHCENFKNKPTTLDLPCKVEDTVYVIKKRYTKCSEYGERYDDSTCQGCCVSCDSKEEYYIEEVITTLYWIVSNLEHFGKTVFLTKEKAKKALEGLKNDSQ